MQDTSLTAARPHSPTPTDALQAISPSPRLANGAAPLPVASEPAAMDPATRALVRAAAVIAVGSETAVRVALADALPLTPAVWIDEMLLQSYLFAGFPRALNGMREWRRISGRSAPADDPAAGAEHARDWVAAGEATCARVYGRFYEPLRRNVDALHPALDAWMIMDGYGKVLSRPALDLGRRELCIVAVCAAAGQDRQLHSHLHGALHVGVEPGHVRDTIDAVADFTPDGADTARRLWTHVLGAHQSALRA